MTEPVEIAAEARQIARGWSGPAAPPSWWLTAALFDGIARDDELVARLADLPAERLPALLASAAILDLARRDPTGGLAPYLPHPGRPQPHDDGGFAAALTSFCRATRDAIVERCRDRRYQMSEVRRSAQVALGLTAVSDPDRPIALVDIGAGAGFGLRLDRYGYAVGDTVVAPSAPADGPSLTLRCEVRGGTPPAVQLPPIAERVGIEVAPLDLDAADDRAWLLACTPPEAGAIDRVAAATEVARAHPARVVAGDAVDALPDVLAALPRDLPIVVVDSYVTVFLDDERRRALAAAMAAAAELRSVTWLALDPLVPLGPDGRDSVQAITVPDAVLDHRADGVFAVLGAWDAGTGRGEVLARAHPSGEWIDWVAAATPG